MQETILKTYEGAGLVGVAVHSQGLGINADAVATDYALTFPMLYDFEMQPLRYYRHGAKPFPLNVIVDREGVIAHIGRDYDEAEAAVVSLLE